MLWSNKIDKIIRKFILRINYKHFTKLKVKGQRQIKYSKTYHEEILVALGCTWKTYLIDDIGYLFGANGSHNLKRKYED